MADNRAGLGQNSSLSLVHDSGKPAKPGKPPAPVVGFDRFELTTILDLYGKKVSSGEWRDYALDFTKDRAMFSIYRRHSERPQFVIEKNPKLRAKQGQYIVTNFQGRILKRGHDLKQVLKVLEPSFAVVK